MKNLITILLVVLITITINAQDVILRSMYKKNVITNNKGEILIVTENSNIDYNFMFSLSKVEIIKNFTGDIVSEIFNIKNYSAKGGYVYLRTYEGPKIILSFDHEFVIIEYTKNNYIHYSLIDAEISDQTCSK